MKLKEVIAIVDNGEFIKDEQFREIEKRVKQIKAYFEIETLYFTSEYLNVFESLIGVFTCEYQMKSYIENNPYQHIQIIKE